MRKSQIGFGISRKGKRPNSCKMCRLCVRTLTKKHGYLRLCHALQYITYASRDGSWENRWEQEGDGSVIQGKTLWSGPHMGRTKKYI